MKTSPTGAEGSPRISNIAAGTSPLEKLRGYLADSPLRHVKAETTPAEAR